MNTILSRYRATVFYFITSSVIVLAIATALLYRQKSEVQQQNRSLILQNDSILSENIHLKNYLRQQMQMPGKNASISSVNYP